MSDTTNPNFAALNNLANRVAARRQPASHKSPYDLKKDDYFDRVGVALGERDTPRAVGLVKEGLNWILSEMKKEENSDQQMKIARAAVGLVNMTARRFLVDRVTQEILGTLGCNLPEHLAVPLLALNERQDKFEAEREKADRTGLNKIVAAEPSAAPKSPAKKSRSLKPGPAPRVNIERAATSVIAAAMTKAGITNDGNMNGAAAPVLD